LNPSSGRIILSGCTCFVKTCRNFIDWCYILMSYCTVLLCLRTTDVSIYFH
jgi:hypothetical protein